MKNPLTFESTRRQLLTLLAGAALATASVCLPISTLAGSNSPSPQSDILSTMKRATTFMRENCAVNGGYVWAYAADFSTQWGEMEAFKSMIWIQPPGTATVGHLYLDVYHATGDEYYYASAVEVAHALIAAQHPSGGWNYLHDFAGEESIQRWYDTIGKNGWRLEEFHHYYGNATFDDAGTSEASQFLLRMYLEKHDQQFKPPMEKALSFILDSQYENGGFPQRFPFVEDAPALHGRPDYTRYITFNDDVAGENIKFLLMVWQTLGDQRALDAINKAMGIFVITQQPAPQAGWGLQHKTTDLSPIGARSYEPDALVTHTTAGNISLMMDFYQWTGNKTYMSRIPEAFAWLDSVRLSGGDIKMPGREFPTFIEIGTNKALINHRRGSNVVNGAYYQDYSPEKPIVHYSQWRQIDLDGLKARYKSLMAESPETLLANSPLTKKADFQLPRFFTTQSIEVSDMNSNVGDTKIAKPDAEEITALVNELNAQGYWPTPLKAVSNPYIGDGDVVVTEGDFSQSRVGDASDTSPYISDNPVLGISLGSYIQNMSTLMQAVEPASDSESASPKEPEETAR